MAKTKTVPEGAFTIKELLPQLQPLFYFKMPELEMTTFTHYYWVVMVILQTLRFS